MPKSTFYFIEYQVEGVLTDVTEFEPGKDRYDLVKETILDYIDTKDVVLEKGDEKWYFGDFGTEGELAFGEFGKVYTDESDLYDEEEGVFVEGAQPNLDADYSMFLIDFSRKLLIYNTRNRIGHQQFRQRFSDGFEKFVDDNVEFHTKFVHNTDSLDHVVNETQVKQADFELEPSNPENEDEWEKLDERIKEMVATEVDFDVRSAKGLNFDEDLLRQALAMSQTKYGNYRIVYDDEDNHIRVLDSDGEPIRKDEEEPDSIYGLSNIANKLIGFADPFLSDDQDE